MKIKISREAAKERLEDQISKGKALAGNKIEYSQGSIDFFKRDLEKWRSFAEDLLKHIFADPKNATEFSNIGNGAFLLLIYPGEAGAFKGYRDELLGQIAYLESCIERLVLYEEPQQSPVQTPKTKTGLHEYVNSIRINELKGLKNYDPTKLIRLCEELNQAFRNESFLSTMMLLRAVLDHVAPIFGVNSFPQVANNYNGTKSFKASMDRLDSSSRKIADAHLHTQIRAKESLPNATQVDFSNDLDVLLAEVVRIAC